MVIVSVMSEEHWKEEATEGWCRSIVGCGACAWLGGRLPHSKFSCRRSQKLYLCIHLKHPKQLRTSSSTRTSASYYRLTVAVDVTSSSSGRKASNSKASSLAVEVLRFVIHNLRTQPTLDLENCIARFLISRTFTFTFCIHHSQHHLTIIRQFIIT